MDSISKPDRSNMRQQPDEEALLTNDTSSEEYQNSTKPRSAMEEYLDLSSDEDQIQHLDCQKSEISANDLKNTNSNERQTLESDHYRNR